MKTKAGLRGCMQWVLCPHSMFWQAPLIGEGWVDGKKQEG